MLRARLQRQLSQTELATRVGTSQNIISLIESGGIERSGFVVGICEALRISPPSTEEIMALGDRGHGESDEIHQRALGRDIGRRLQLASHDELRVLDRVLLRLELGREEQRPPEQLAVRELLDQLVRHVCEEIATEDQARAELHEAARREMLGEPTPSEVTP